MIGRGELRLTSGVFFRVEAVILQEHIALGQRIWRVCRGGIYGKWMENLGNGDFVGLQKD